MKFKFLLLFLLGITGLSAQTVEVNFSGQVNFVLDDNNLEPVPGYPVYLQYIFPDGTNVEATTETNEDGIYSFALDIPPIGVLLEVHVSTFDFCNGEALAYTHEVAPDATVIYEADFSICAGIDPPPPPTDCEAYFYYEQTNTDPLTIQFLDLSFSPDNNPITEWHWDFGDGHTSDEAEPSHDYGDVGEYGVSLTITADTCSSSYTLIVYVNNIIDCVCPAIYDPVCVIADNGDIITFENPCYAECEGYNPNDFIACDEDCICPEYYDPVCALSSDGDTITFDNICFAECEGFGPDQVFDCEDDCVCPDIWDPVCAISPDGTITTFSNLCEALCAGYDPAQFVPCQDEAGCYASFFVEQEDFSSLVVSFVDNSYSTMEEIIQWEWELGDGTTSSEQNPTHEYAESGIYDVILTIVTADGCTSTTIQHICIGFDENCVCDDVYDPVCVLIPGTPIIITFPNLCEAECAGFSEANVVDCDTNSCGCPEYYDPVCALSADGDTITFDNICFAECEGFGPDQVFDCNIDDPCNCDDVFDPVCVTFNGIIITFENACFAECEGFGPDSFVDCEDGGCICPDIFAPVCVVSNGDTISFVNSCFAECEGFGPDSFIDCDTDFPCDCPFIFDPVCVLTAAGEILFFPNACIAECEGFEEDDFIDCEDDGFDDCYATFYIDQSDPASLTVMFIDESFTEAGTIDSWTWEFGDGTTGTGSNPTHIYAEEGIYEVNLTITTSEGCTSTTTQHICIGDGGIFGGPDCQAMFFFNQETDNPNTFEFFDMSFGAIDSWSWDFGDGNTSEEQNPTHTYDQNGVYFVTLTITAGDCESTATMLLISNQDVWYDNSCTALFLPFIIQDNSEVFFLNLSSPDAVEFNWDLGDGTTSNEFIVFHQYADPGIYEVTLTITTADGCTSSFSVTLDLDGNNFTGNPEFLTVSDTEEEVLLNKVQIHPNPASDLLTLSFKAEQASEYQLEIIGLNGQVIRTIQGDAIAGNNQRNLNISPLQSGVYLLRLQTGKEVKTLKLVKE